MGINSVAMQLDSAATSSEVAERLRSLTELGPFEVTSVTSGGSHRHECRFGLKRPGMAVGYGSVIELQHRVIGDFDIVGVERNHLDTLDAVTS